MLKAYLAVIAVLFLGVALATPQSAYRLAAAVIPDVIADEDAAFSGVVSILIGDAPNEATAGRALALLEAALIAGRPPCDALLSVVPLVTPRGVNMSARRAYYKEQCLAARPDNLAASPMSGYHRRLVAVLRAYAYALGQSAEEEAHSSREWRKRTLSFV